ncbi:MAG TPA: class I SAM-dependent methyltransferase [Gemmatimonadales bacterium]|nr:class I SAM-dependent methyltransferase [Gemmatimonadales bacterium]
MPSIQQNLRAWSDEKSWVVHGDEWSTAWGGTAAQWQGAILPRIRDYLPAHHILEIAPGHGRWTQFLATQADTLTLVDLSPRCIAVCRERFAEMGHLRYHVNDGRSLTMLPDQSVDFAFSFDSLVHAELPVIESYLRELGRVLTPNGIAFLHHSNLGAFGAPGVTRRQLPDFLYGALMARGLVPQDHWRAYSVSADLVRDLAVSAGVPCIRQELVNWGCDRLIDCFSTVTPIGSRWARPLERVANSGFMAEAAAIRAGVGR